MIVVFTSESIVPKEAYIINHLFEEGLEVLHLRKPNKSLSECSNLINSIETKFHDRIMIHQHHVLTEKYNLKGIHFKESDRIHLGDNMYDHIKYMKLNGFEISTGFHDISTLLEQAYAFNYVFLSPIYNSISKEGYNGKKFDFERLKKRKEKIFALGGINKTNISEVFKMGFDGSAVLGAVWKSDNPIATYNELQNLNNNSRVFNSTTI